MEKKNKFKEIIQNKQYRALIILGLYFVFFTVVLVSIKPVPVSKKPTPDIVEESDVLEKYKKMEEYKFHYKVNYLEEQLEVIELTGTLTGNVYEFQLNDVTYRLSNDNLFIVEEEKLVKINDEVIEKVLSFNPENIYNLIKASVLTSKTEMFGDNSIKKTYHSNIDEQAEAMIVIVETIEKENIINEITIKFEDVDTNPFAFHNIQSLVVSYERE